MSRVPSWSKLKARCALHLPQVYPGLLREWRPQRNFIRMSSLADDKYHRGAGVCLASSGHVALGVG